VQLPPKMPARRPSAKRRHRNTRRCGGLRARLLLQRNRRAGDLLRLCEVQPLLLPLRGPKALHRWLLFLLKSDPSWPVLVVDGASVKRRRKEVPLLQHYPSLPLPPTHHCQVVDGANVKRRAGEVSHLQRDPNLPLSPTHRCQKVKGMLKALSQSNHHQHGGPRDCRLELNYLVVHVSCAICHVTCPCMHLLFAFNPIPYNLHVVSVQGASLYVRE